MQEIQRQIGIGIEGKLKRTIQPFKGLFHQSISLKREECSTRSESGEDDGKHNSAVLTNYLEDEENVSACLTWFFWLDATHPSVESKILAEIRENLPANIDDRMIAAAVDANVLPLGHHVKKNMRIMLSFYPMARLEEIWGKDFMEFKLERWISEQGGLVYVPSHKLIAFNTGPRLCLGRDMSFIQMKAIATAVPRNYHIQWWKIMRFPRVGP
ncbi:hypothetical protein TIFTF001_031242 [Ficus carica]|uniref:Cytochrome P450 n=1 Tax=Ficus carica TaxID=3494 RepID=A0AA88DUN0_FICCA|nr:hypothetical protein TIFTF001_031242 [Ficus carica]